MKHYVYIIKCGDGTYYTGYTNRLIVRYIQHCCGKGAKYTKGRGPLTLMYAEEFKTKSEAMKWEYKVKQFRREKKEELIYNVGINDIKEITACQECVA